MNRDQIIQALKNEAKTNPVAASVFTVWGSRHRARNQVTIQALSYRMKDSGFQYEASDYVKVLKVLITLGLGTPMTVGGRLVGIRDVKMTLQSIGKAAMQGGESLEMFKRRNRYSKLIVAKPLVGASIPAAARVGGKVAKAFQNLHIAVSVGSKMLRIDIPEDFTGEEISTLVSQLRGQV